MRLQISLDYIIILSFVLVVFILVFGSVATQRSLAATQQVFSQLQLIAQSVASQISVASQSGNGYSSTFSLTSALNLPAYNVTITKTGTVIASANISGRLVQAVAYGTAKSVISSDSYLAGNNKAYVLPTLQGSIPIQNSQGNVCVDVQCPSTSFLAQNIALNARTILVGNFNGKGSMVNTGNSSGLDLTGNMTISVWMRTTSTAVQKIFQKYGSSPTYTGYALATSNTCNKGLVSFWSSGIGTWQCSGSAVTDGSWHNIIITASGSNALIYVDGVQNGAFTYTAPGDNANTQSYIGSMYGTGDFFNGSIANVQIYSSGLNSSQAGTVYARGISGLPLSSNSLVGWWPLNGDAKDHSGNGLAGNPTAVSYSTVSQLNAKVTNSTGAAVGNTLVGFSTSIGSFYNTSRTISNYTNSSGVATALLNQGSYTGSALVKATAFPGNVSTIKNLSAWYPMNFGSGANALDIGADKAVTGNALQNSNTLLNMGAMVNASWSMPGYVGSFNGHDGSIGTGNGSSIDITGAITISAWIRTSSASQQMVFQKYSAQPYYYGYALALTVGCGSGQLAFWSSGVSAWRCSNATVDDGQWHNVVVTGTGATGTFYIDGLKSNTFAFTAPTNTINAQGYIGSLWGGKAGYYFNGSMADVQVYSAALNATQVAQLYGQGISAPPAGGSALAGWWPLNGDANDYSGNGNNGTIGGSFSFVPAPVQQQASVLDSVKVAKLNGTSSGIALQSTSAQISGPRAYLAWVYPTLLPSGTGYPVIVGGATGAGDMMGIENSSLGAGNCENLYIDHWGTSCYANSTPLSLSKWSQVGFSYNGNVVTFYVNGKPAGTVTGTLYNYSANTLTFGIDNIGGSTTRQYLNGSMANVQVYNSSLSQSQVLQSYRNGIEGFPVSNSIIGWWPLNGDANDYSGNNNDATASNVLYGHANQSFYRSYGAYGINLNGQNRSFVSFPANSLVAAPGALSMWVYLGSVGGSDSEPTFMSSGSAYLALGPSNTLEFYTGSGWTSAATGALSLDAWHNIAMVYNTSYTQLYVDGANVLYSANTLGTAGNTIYLGARSDLLHAPYLLNGSIADVQIYNSTLTANQIYQLYNNQLPRIASVAVPLGVGT